MTDEVRAELSDFPYKWPDWALPYPWGPVPQRVRVRKYRGTRPWGVVVGVELQSLKPTWADAMRIAHQLAKEAQ